MNSTLLIDADALRTNFRIFRQATESKIMQVVKANAYGHGLKLVVKELLEEGVDGFGVVNVQEAEEIRAISETVSIYLLGVIPSKDYPRAVQLSCIVPVWRLDQTDQLDAIGKEEGVQVSVQIKVDTGMGRLGLPPSDCEAFLLECRKYKNISFKSIYTHFAAADSAESESYLGQFERFMSCVALARLKLDRRILAHAANSPAFIRDERVHLDMVRLGIACYGIAPDREIPLPRGVRPVATWTSTLENVKVLPPGHGVSYGPEFITDRPMCVGVVPVGYADGFRRVPRNCNLVSIKGKLVPVLGRVCMDHFVVDLTEVSEPMVGDTVFLLAQGGGGQLTAQALAGRWKTNEYDVMCNIGPRVARLVL